MTKSFTRLSRKLSSLMLVLMLSLSMNVFASDLCEDVTDITLLSVSTTEASIQWGITDVKTVKNPTFRLIVSTVEIAETDLETATGDVLDTNLPTTARDYDLTDLSSNTVYYVYMRTDCESGGQYGGYGEWKSLMFKTYCEVTGLLPIEQNFDNGVIGDCWNTSGKVAVSSSTRYGTSGYSASLAADVDKALGAYLISPIMAADVSNLGVTFRAYGAPYEGNNREVSVGIVMTSGDMSSVELVSTIAINTSWNEYYVPISEDYAGFDNVSIVIYVSASDIATPVYIDEIRIFSDACKRPIDLLISDITSSSALLSWTQVGEPQSWLVKLVQGNDIQELDADTNPFLLDGLEQNTAYSVQIKALCDAAGESEWSESKDFMTECPQLEVPYSENFDSYEYKALGVPECWTFPGTTGTQTAPKVAINTSLEKGFSATGAATDRALVFASGSSKCNILAILPPSNLVDLSGYQARFMYCYQDLSVGDLYFGYVTDLNDTTTFHALTAKLPRTANYNAADGAGKYEKEVSLAELPANAKALAFKYVGTSSKKAAIDNFVIEPLPACPKPTVIRLGDYTSETAEFSWHDIGAGTEWDVIVTLNDVEVFNETVQDTLVTIDGLAPNTQYSYRISVTAVCESETSGTLTESGSFKTPCGSISLPYSEDFENVALSTMPDCWTGAKNSGTLSVSDATSYVTLEGRYLYFYAGSGGCNMVAVMPPIDGVDVTGQQIAFNYSYESLSIGELCFGYVTSLSDTSSFVALEVLPRATAKAMYEAEISLADVPAEAKALAFKYYATSNYYSGVDNIEITQLPSCFKPQTISNTARGQFDVTFSIIDPDDSHTQWEVAVINGQDSIKQITTEKIGVVAGLQPNTPYTLAARTICSDEDMSVWVTGSSFRTECGPLGDDSGYFEDFESYTSIDDLGCWTVTSRVDISTSANYCYGGTGHCLFFRYTQEWALMPEMAFSLNNAAISFYASFESATSSGNLVVGYADPEDYENTFVPVMTVTPETDVNIQNPTQYTVVFLDQDVPDGYVVAFHYDKENSAYWYLGIDQIQIRKGSECPSPGGLSAFGITDNSATLEWSGETENFIVSFFDHEIPWLDLQDATPLRTITVAGDYSLELTELEPNTTFYVAVQGVCDGDELSDFSRLIRVKTECNEKSIPYNEDFEAQTTQFDCWNVISGSASLSTAAAATGTQSLYIDNEATLVLPRFSGSLADYQFKADIRSGSPITLNVGVVLDPADASSMINLSTITVPGDNAFHNYAVFFSDLASNPQLAPYAGAHYITLQAPAANNISVFIDDVEVSMAPVCMPATSLMVRDLTDTGALLTWAKNGNENFVVKVYDQPYAEELVPVINVDVTGGSYQIENLTPNTQYYAYVTAICDGGIEAEMSSAYSLHTTPTPRTIPFATDFENDTENADWFFISNATSSGEAITNHWVVGSATSNGGSKSMYVTDDGTANNYTVGSKSGSWTYLVVRFDNPGTYMVSFDWKGKGESSWDYMLPFLIPADVEFGCGADTLTIDGSVIATSSTLNMPEDERIISLSDGQKLNQQEQWQTLEKEFQISSSGTYFLAFAWKNDGSVGTQPPAAIDNISVSEILCPSVTGLSVSDVTENAVTLIWDAVAEADGYQYIVLPAGESILSVDEADLLVTSETTATVSDLLPLTSYTAYVRAYNQSGTSAAWAKASFRTDCSVYALPYFENFNNMETGEEPDCWNIYVINETGSDSEVYVSASNGVNGSKSLIFEQYEDYDYYYDSETFSDTLYAALPSIDAEMSTAVLDFWYKNTSATASAQGSLLIGYLTSEGDFSSFQVLETLPHVDEMTEYSRNLNDLPQGASLAFCYRTIAGYYPYNAYVDNINVYLNNGCDPFENVTLSDSTTNSITVTIDLGDNAQWQYAIAKQGQVSLIENLTVSDPQGESTITIDGLDAATNYELYIRRYCDDNNQSRWAQYLFTTLCESYSIEDFHFDFETASNHNGFATATGGEMPLCWEYVSTASYLPYATSSYSAPGSDYGLYLPYISNGNIGVLTLPAVDVPEGTAYRVLFDFYHPSTTATTYQSEALKVYIGNSTDYESCELAGTFLHYDEATRWTTHKVRVNASGTVYVHFVQSSAGGTSYYLDNILIDEVPSCEVPSDFKLETVKAQEASLKWIAGGQETLWELAYSIHDANQNVFADTIVVSEPKYTVSGLQPITAYSGSAMLRAICAEGDTSIVASLALSFSTPAIPQQLPVITGFEPSDPAMFQFVAQTGTTVNLWTIGTGTNNGGTQAMYIANQSDLSTNAYNISTTSAAWAFVNFEVPADGEYGISYDWKCNGEGTTTIWDYARAFLMNSGANLTVSSGSGYIDGTSVSYSGTPQVAGVVSLDGEEAMHGETTWQHVELIRRLTAGEYKIAFFWRNDPSVGNQPPAAIDNFAIESLSCRAPSTPTIGSLTSQSAKVTWAARGTETQWQIDYMLNEGEDSQISGSETVSETPEFVISGLLEETQYSGVVSVRAVCSEEQMSDSRTVNVSFETLGHCPKPSDFTISAEDHSVLVEWYSPMEITTWNVNFQLNGEEAVDSVLYEPRLLLNNIAANSDHTLHVSVKAVCTSEESSPAAADDFTFHTMPEIMNLPYNCGFEGDEALAWVYVNSSPVSTNHWIIGSATNAVKSGTSAMYITNDDATAAYAYTVSTTSASWAYVTLNVAQAGTYNVSFDWKANGESNYDYLRAAIMPASANMAVVSSEPQLNGNGFTYSTAPSIDGFFALDSISSSTYKLNQSSSWNTVDKEIYIGTPGYYVLAFMWRNDYSAGTMPPAAVDNISISKLTCEQVRGISLVSLSDNSAELSFNAVEDAEAYQYILLDADATPNAQNESQIVTTQQTAISLSELESNKAYALYLRTVCDSEEAEYSKWAKKEFKTSCSVMAVPDFNFTFDGEEHDGWSASYSTARVADCWDVQSRNTSIPYVTVLTGSESDDYSLYMPSMTGTRDLVMPYVNIPDEGTFVFQLDFYSGSSASNNDSIAVYVNTAPSVEGATALLEPVKTVNVSGGAWVTLSYQLDLTGDVYFILRQIGHSGSAFYLDDINIEERFACQVYDLAVLGVSDMDATLTWTTPGDNIVKYEVELNGIVYESEQPSYHAVGLDESMEYQVRVRALCGADWGEWSDYVEFSTVAAPSTTLPYFSDFETASGRAVWELHNAALDATNDFTNYWMFGRDQAGVASGNSTGLYITDDGEHNAYTISDVSWPFATASFRLAEGEYNLSFDWKANGESSFDFMRIFFVPAGIDIHSEASAFYIGSQSIANTTVPSARGAFSIDATESKPYFNRVTEWVTHQTSFTITESGIYNMVILWRNDYSQGDQTPAAIGNISLVKQACGVVENVAASDITAQSANLSWDAVEGATSYKVVVLPASQRFTDAIAAEAEDVATPEYLATNLNASTIYMAYISIICEEGQSSWTRYKFATECETTPLPYVEDFTNQTVDELPLCWAVETRYAGNTSPATVQNNLDPAIDGNALYIEGMNSSTNSGTIFTMLPEFSQALDNAILTFTYRGESTYTFAPQLSVGYLTNAADTTTFQSLQQLESTLVATEVSITLPEGIGNGRLAFRFQPMSTYSNYSVAIDDISIRCIADVENYDNEYICYGYPYQEHGFDLTVEELTAGEHNFTIFVPDQQGSCEIQRNLHLFVQEAITAVYRDTVCAGESYSGYGFEISAANVQTRSYQKTGLQSYLGCDSIAQLNLVVFTEIPTEEVTICYGQSVERGGEEFSTEGYHQYPTLNSRGCEVMGLLHLIVTQEEPVEHQAVICAGEVYTDEIFTEGYTEPSVYTVEVPDEEGCVVVHNLTLVVLPNATGDTLVIVGRSDLPYKYEDQEEIIVPAEGVLDGQTFTAQYYYTASNGCDSLLTVRVRVELDDALREINSQAITLSPNPIQRGGSVYVNYDFTPAQRNGLRVEVIDMTGKQVTAYKPDYYPLQVSEFNVDGLYLVRITTGTGEHFHGRVLVK